MESRSRSELLNTVETQQDKIKKYEAKLRDLIQAYKGILTEKEALESSLKALSTIKPAPREPPNRDVNTTKQSDDNADNDETGDRNTVEGETVDDREIEQLREQLATLTSALSTVTEEKSKLASSYQTEKKNLLHTLEENKATEKELKASKQDELQQMEDDIQQWKNKVRMLQIEREKLEDDHAIALRELQKLLSVERITKEHIENQLDEAKQTISEHEHSDASKMDIYVKQTRDLKAELSGVKERLRDTESEASKPSLQLLDLQQETATLKAQHRIDMQQERQRANDAEEQLRAAAQQSEERVCVLEAKLSELSEVVGNYERLRYQDQSAIQKLKERVSQLDMENMALARAAHSSGATAGGEADTEDLDVQTILDRLAKLKGLLKLANEKSEKPVDIEELLKGDPSTMDDSNLHRKCKDDLHQLKEEYERYKLRAQSVLKNKSVKEPSPNKDLEAAKEHVTELKERLRVLRADYEDQHRMLKEKEENFRKTLSAVEEKHRQALALQVAENKQKMSDLEGEIRKHRDRTIALLVEKDKEILTVRAKLPAAYATQYVPPYRPQLHSQGSDPSGEAGASSEESAVSELLGRTSVLGGTPAETSLLHFAHEQARKNVEVDGLRRQKHSLELALRELQQSGMLKQEACAERIDALTEDIRKLERNKSRESANLEYLKNVVFQYVLSTDATGRHQMLNAISTILEFSPKERTAVSKHTSGGWWVYGGGKSPKYK